MRAGFTLKVLIAGAIVVVAAIGAVLVSRRPPSPLTPMRDAASDLQLGMVTFQQNCAVCHGTQAEGKDYAPPLNHLGHAHHHPDWELLTVIAEGRQGFGEMPAWKGKLSDREMRAVIAYIKTLWEDGQRRFQNRVNQLRPEPP